jgi:hypothetical protein
MIVLKSMKNLSLFICEEELCEDESTQIWASSESRIVDLCDLHYSEATKYKEKKNE